jgi:hypothetical protein
MSNCPLPTAETLLNNEITWLKKIRVSGLSAQHLLGVETQEHRDELDIISI